MEPNPRPKNPGLAVMIFGNDKVQDAESQLRYNPMLDDLHVDSNGMIINRKKLPKSRQGKYYVDPDTL